MVARADLFLSWARGDDESFVTRLYGDLSVGWKVWWDRASMPSRGLKFTQEIRDAIDNSDRLLLISGLAQSGLTTFGPNGNMRCCLRKAWCQFCG
jgi:hypothetical protein